MTLHVTENESALRLDKLLVQRFPNYSRQYFQHLIRQHLVLVNGNIAKKALKLEIGDEVEIEFSLTPEISLEPEAIPLDILFEDNYLIAINKPADMVVHPAVGHWSGTFVNALLYHCTQLPTSTTLRPGIIHRLDKDTTGVLLAAKDEVTQQLMVKQFANKLIQKQYLAICIGNPGNKTIEGNIGRHPIHRKKMAVLENRGKEAKTICKTLSYNAQFSLVHLFPETGRTHQLRVHLKSIGTPILGDKIYGNPSINKKWGVKRQLLHAEQLQFTHPIEGKEISIKACIPEDMEKMIKQFSFKK